MDVFFESLIAKLQCSPLAELQESGRKSYLELSKVIPSFVRRADPTHKNQISYFEYKERLTSEMKAHSLKTGSLSPMKEAGVRLIDYDADGPVKVAAALLFSESSAGLHELQEYCQGMERIEREKLFRSISSIRQNRRHKSPRALEHASFTFEICADYGIYRDLQRHRMLTQERQLLTCDYGYYVPEEIKGSPLEEEYCRAMDSAKQAFDTMAKALPEEAQYVVPMALQHPLVF